MKYILEIRNPEQIDSDKFYKMVRTYLSTMINLGKPVPVEVFSTANERLTSLKHRSRISTSDTPIVHSIKYESMDLNASQDYFCTGVEIADEDVYAFNQGRGALIPRIYNSTLKELNLPYYWLDRPELAATFPAYTAGDALLDANGFYWFNGSEPIIHHPAPDEPQFVIIMDYVQKGGQ